jgi:hypothetical protein
MGGRNGLVTGIIAVYLWLYNNIDFLSLKKGEIFSEKI